MKLPVYKLTVLPETNDTGAEYTALVDEPAIEKYFLTFRKNDDGSRLLFASQEQRIITGPLMIPDLPIYRAATGQIPENHYVVFDKETIRQVVYKFCRDNNFNRINLMHESGTDPQGVYMIESFISDSHRGTTAPLQFQDLPDGTWYVSYKIDNDALWERIKKAEFRGLSIEGIFTYVETGESDEERMLREIEAVIKRMESE
jgi:hypothetical protein